ncbi:hypothetical protein ACIPRI_00225 [Variovorax sp. LARHSF232]
MILVKTEAGHLALRDRALGLSPRQRSAFILFDGKRSVSDVLAAGLGVTQQDIEQMLSLGMLGVPGDGGAGVAAAAPAQVQMAPSAAAPEAGRTPQERYQAAYPVATRLTASLGLRGFKLNLQVEGATSFEELLALAPKIRAAVSSEMAAELERALKA